VLRELRIENLLLIESAELRFGPGLNAITGETGAGKTILAHSLDLLMGGKARGGIVRPGAEEAYVEGVFAMPAALLDDPELAATLERLPGRPEVSGDSAELVLGRRVSAAGRTAAFVQSRSASAADLKALGARLLAFYGQHEHRKLTLASAQMQILDGFAGAEHLELLGEYRRAHAALVALNRELDELRERDGARERDLDLLRFELEEIEAAAPDSDEQLDLTAERDRLRHAEGLREASGESLISLTGDSEQGGGAAVPVAEAEAALARVQGVDADLDRLAERVRGLGVELGDAAGELRSYRESIDGQPGRLGEVEEQLETIDRLERKHGGSIEAVLAHAERCRLEIHQLENTEERTVELEARIAPAAELRAGLGEELSRSRQGAAKELAVRVRGELASLAMEGASLEVGLEPHPDGFGSTGRESVELRVATNPGLPVAPLRDAASGGELSRLMLALTGLGPAAGSSTFVFDEIDSGVGGNTARAVGERLRRLGDERQVIAITHLPQVASMASTHFRIEKVSDRTPALARVEQVLGEELVAEITRMLGADRADGAASRHARELLAA
jgi:DNA repair protein RecN (Recombination protein N)